METEKITLKQKAKNVISLAKEYWDAPAKGNYIPYKEVTSLSAAGFGAQWTTMLASTIALDAGNFLVGASLELEPLHLQYMLIIANIIGIPIGVWRGWYIDNHNMKGGKFLPFILRTAFPIVFLAMIMVWLPYERWSYITKVVVVWCFYMVMQVFLCLYNESYQTLQYVMSPNAQERANTMGITQVIYSLAPTISNLFIPMLAKYTGGLNSLETYRIIYPPFTIIGLVLNTIFFLKVKERIVLPKKKPEPVRIIDAVREVSKNKYFWITQSAAWVGFLENAYGVILGWTFVYSFNGEKQELLGIANTVIGNAALWAMISAPILIRALGKRNLLIICNLVNVVLLTWLYQVYESMLLVCVFWFLNNFINVINNNINLPNINADMRDYHQWKTGVRIDGLFGPVGMIGTFIGFFTGLIIPSIYERMGLKDDYNVLYTDEMRFGLFKVLIVASILGAILNLIPYLFYDLTEDKHRGYVKVLKIRAMFEDYGLGELEDELLVDAMGVIISARECRNEQQKPIHKSALRQAKKLKRKTPEEKAFRKSEITKAKKEIRMQREHNCDIFTSPFVMDELTKFSTERFIRQVQAAKDTYALGRLGNYGDIKELMSQARALPKKTKQEKEIRSDAIALVRKKKVAARIIEKVGRENLKEPDERIKKEILERESHSLKESISNQRELKEFMKKASEYGRAVAPYENAKNLIEQSENYSHFAEIEERYNELVGIKSNSAE